MYKLMFYLRVVNKTRRLCHSWLAEQKIRIRVICAYANVPKSCVLVRPLNIALFKLK